MNPLYYLLIGGGCLLMGGLAAIVAIFFGYWMGRKTQNQPVWVEPQRKIDDETAGIDPFQGLMVGSIDDERLPTI